MNPNIKNLQFTAELVLFALLKKILVLLSSDIVFLFIKKIRSQLLPFVKLFQSNVSVVQANLQQLFFQKIAYPGCVSYITFQNSYND